MSALLLFTDHCKGAEQVLPALRELPHVVSLRPVQGEDADSLTVDVSAACEGVLVDARHDIAAAKGVCQALCGQTGGRPLIAVLADGGLVTLNTEWGVDDVLLPTAGADEITMRLRLAAARRRPAAGKPVAAPGRVEPDPSLDVMAFTAGLCGQPIRLTFAEHQILYLLASRPGQIFTYDQLLDSYGGGRPGSPRTIHSHVRRLRAKLGPERATMVQTIRSLGYRLRAEPRG